MPGAMQLGAVQDDDLVATERATPTLLIEQFDLRRPPLRRVSAMDYEAPSRPAAFFTSFGATQKIAP